jgi:hypothetical protein
MPETLILERPAAVAREMTSAHAFVGVVVAAHAGGWMVAQQGAPRPARRAASCLLKPETGDTVACLRTPAGQGWITAVLERAANTPQTWHCDGPVQVEIEGAIALSCETVDIRSAQFSVNAHTVAFTADETRFVGERMKFLGRQVQFVGAALHSVFERASHFSRSYLRRTEGLDRVQADHLEQEATQMLRMSAEHTMIDGEKLVKARGGQIHFG